MIRSFVIEPFRIPSGSLKPTLLVGDFILVNKFDYGLRLPVTGTKILPFHEPTVGDIVVFRYPQDPSIDYIKRFIAKAGDHIQYKNKVLTINNKKIPQKFVGYALEHDEYGNSWKVEERKEIINNHPHSIYLRSDRQAKDFDTIVPAGTYFAMGDNRDASSDSRVWGPVPEKNIVGKAFAIWMSWDKINLRIRWQRVGQQIH